MQHAGDIAQMHGGGYHAGRGDRIDHFGCNQSAVIARPIPRPKPDRKADRLDGQIRLAVA